MIPSSRTIGAGAVLLIVIALGATLSGQAAAAFAPGTARGQTVDRGIVLAVSPIAISLLELDGTTMTLRVGRRTRVVLDGKPASLQALRRGFVAIVRHVGDRPARLVQAFDTAAAAGRGSRRSAAV